ncbi:MAG TPA: DUF4920 domain-containing protein [Saprospiraceae bacterium]|nr:DUF4920 domain-containing protein [Saprospiraceae bacterium]
MKKIFFALIMTAGLGLIGCQSSPKAEGDGKTFGAGVADQASAQEFGAVMGQLDSVQTINVTMKGKVTNVCQKKGCWMNITDPTNTSTEEMFVQFEDYGFFMPKDLAGHTVIMQGKAYTDTTSVEDLKHFAEDANKSEEEIAAITEPSVEKKFMATGVIIVD